MSASLVRKTLALLDDTDVNYGISKRKRKADLIPENHKVIRKVNRKGKTEKVNLLQKQKKLTVAEAKKSFKSQETIYKENLKKLKLIKEATRIDLDEELTSQIIERAITRCPVKTREKRKEPQKTAFTEEDFKKFEEEYYDE